MHPLLALALVLVAGIGVTHLSRPSLRYPRLVADVLATGVAFVLLGLLLGPVLGVPDKESIRLLEPIQALALGWIGALFGVGLEWRFVRRISTRTWLVGATLALPLLLTTTVIGVVLARRIPALATAWGHPTLAVALALGGALTTAARHRGPRLGRRTALIGTVFGAIAVVGADALYQLHLAPRALALTVTIGLGLGGVFVALARTGLLHDPVEAGVAVVAVLCCGAGASYAAGLSPFVVCALAAAVFTSFSPIPVRRAARRLLARWEATLYAAFLILSGALLRPLTAWVLFAAPSFTLVRVLVRWITVRFGLDRVDPLWRSLPFAPPREFAYATIRQDATAVALAGGFDLAHG
ncbi:MAG TPA: hypothetical protein VE714_01680, partial [Gemmatimonadales bacterium]|nr:hypothetical protein [Gemmatimonadales bacterium]